MQDIKLGQLAPIDAKRDAVHIAVIPIVAGTKLDPGDHVGIGQSDGKAYGAAYPGVGIVDPFLNVSVRPNQTFWLFMLPGTTKQLRHDWSHDAFPEKEEEPEAAPFGMLGEEGNCSC